jgi:hypothetical protein
VTIARAPISRACAPEQRVARRAGALLNAGRRLVAAPDENAMGDAEARAQRADRRRFVGALLAQAVVDGRRGESRRLRRALRPLDRHGEQRGRIRAARNGEQRCVEFGQRREKRVDRRRGEPGLAAQQ